MCRVEHPQTPNFLSWNLLDSLVCSHQPGWRQSLPWNSTRPVPLVWNLRHTRKSPLPGFQFESCCFCSIFIFSTSSPAHPHHLIHPSHLLHLHTLPLFPFPTLFCVVLWLSGSERQVDRWLGIGVIMHPIFTPPHRFQPPHFHPSFTVILTKKWVLKLAKLIGRQIIRDWCREWGLFLG